MFGLSARASAQIGTGTLTGRVVDASSKKPLGDVVVTASSPSLQGEQTVLTDASGTFRIPTLPPGAYTLRFEADTFKPYERGGIELAGSVTLRADAELLPEMLKAEEVTVIARPPTVDVGSARSGVTIGEDFTSRVPVAAPSGKGGGSRSFEQLALVAPTVHVDEYGVSIAGTSSPENQFLIDGMSVGDPGFGYNAVPLSMEFVKEVSVITGGYLPEYGRGGGGVLDVVTKSGSNEFHGSVFGSVTPWQAKPKDIMSQDAISTSRRLRSTRDFGFDIGGPIVKDKLWFYLGADVSNQQFTLYRDLNLLETDPVDGKYVRDPSTGLIRSSHIPGTERQYIAESGSLQYIGKLTYSPTTDDRIELTHRGTPSSGGGNGNYSIDYATGLPSLFGAARGDTVLSGPYQTTAWKQVFDSYDTSVKWTHSAFNKRLTFDTIVGWHNEHTGDHASDGSEIGSGMGLSNLPAFIYRRTSPQPHSITDFESLPDPSICTNPVAGGDARCPVSRYELGGPNLLSDRHYNRYTGRELITLVAEGLGHHIIKAGAEFEYMNYDSQKAYAGGPEYRETTDGQSVGDFRRYGGLTGPDDAYTLDPLRMSTHSISAGAFVQDSWSIMDAITLNAGFRYDTQLLYADDGLSLTLPNQWSPRLGLIYDPTQQGRSKIFFNYAVYYQTLPLNIMDRAGSGEPQIRSSRPISACNATSSSYPSGCDARDNLSQIGGPVNANQYWAYLMSGKLAIDSDIKPPSSSEISAGAEYEIVPNGRLGFTYIHRWTNSVIEDMSRDEGNTFFLGNPGSGIASDYPKATRVYDAGILSFTKLFADSWLAQASYTLSYLRGNWEGLFRSQTGQLDPGTTSDFDLKELVINHSGPLDSDRRHEIKLFVAKDFAPVRQHHINVGLGYHSMSGRPTNYLGAQTYYGFDEVFLLPRGSGEREPWVHSIDLHVGYTFFHSKNQSLQFALDIFNLFNFQAVTKTVERYTVRDVEPIVGADANSPFVNGDKKTIRPEIIRPSDATAPPFENADKNLGFGAPIAYQDPFTLRFSVKGAF